ncbi:hypothetical protein BKA70DRAFT_553037 [Coprinopsis sp. MPI-PUGE-AT-0042]|nr:hypothetical protein BKA70DRAFT_553037 [Coprinopsis sp. MPI-PUGE-AT-0042]
MCSLCNAEHAELLSPASVLVVAESVILLRAQALTIVSATCHTEPKVNISGYRGSIRQRNRLDPFCRRMLKLTKVARI